jgi:hypothetical protein
MLTVPIFIISQTSKKSYSHTPLYYMEMKHIDVFKYLWLIFAIFLITGVTL